MAYLNLESIRTIFTAMVMCYCQIRFRLNAENCLLLEPKMLVVVVFVRLAKWWNFDRILHND